MHPEDYSSRPPLLRQNQLYLILACSFITYNVVERILHGSLRHLFPSQYHQLRTCGKAGPFVALIIGFVVALFISPVCYQSYIELPILSRPDFAHPGIAEICVGVRTVLWLEELSRLCDGPLPFLHHASCLFIVVFGMSFDLPGLKYSCAVLASLITEVGATMTMMMSLCGLKSSNRRWIWWLEFVNVVSVVAIRFPAVYLLSTAPWHEGLPLALHAFWIVMAVLYVTYQTYIAYAKIRKLLRVKLPASKVAPLAT